MIDAHGACVVLDFHDEGLPGILHWGSRLPGVSDDDSRALRAALSRQTRPATLDAPWQVSLSPQEADAWSGRPGMQLRRDGVLLRPRWHVESISPSVGALRIAAADAEAALRLGITIRILPGGVVQVQQQLTNEGADPVDVDWIESILPVPTTADTLLTFDGRWTREKRPVVTAMPAGATVRQSRRGRPGHDAPSAMVATVGAPRWTQGDAWAAHVAWSADVTYRVDRITDSVTQIGGGEMLRPGELVLAPADTVLAPPVLFAHSARGLNGIAHAFHTMLRARPEHPLTARPFVLNTWEAVYFDHDPAKLRALAERAAAVGVERFVLDDGWFTGRRDDTTSLGDWVVDRERWPGGLEPLADHVHSLGMQFGLWFEPEMISLDSDLARRHPDWLLHDPRHLAHDPLLSWRTQFVLDLARADAYAHIFGCIDELVGRLGIDFIKWDHNRDLVESVHDGRPGVHAQTLAVHRMFDELKAAHPGLEIESCSSGGARTDLGMLAHADRVWASDSNDPVERQDIQRWTGLLLPPELVGAHVGPAEAHSSGRVTPLSYRMATSLMGSAGLEWDILGCSEDEIAAIERFTALYRELRPIVHAGRTVHPDLRDGAWRVTGFVGETAAVYVVATVASLEDARAERLRMPDLSPDHRYRVRVRDEIGAAAYGWIAPEWFTTGEIELPGAVLREIGLQLPTLWPVQAFVLHVEAV
ncbi:alpha-galactosidase [Actinomycetales bacterium SN12]|nr:alpha-galactosidase [Actinomycetales bacterium SN12]